MMSQKDGTYDVVVKVLKQFGRTINSAEQVVLSSEERAECMRRLCTMFDKQSIYCSKNYTIGGLKTYVGGLLSNWLKKDRRLNGDIKFELKNPGSRADNTTPEIDELRKLMKKVKDTPDEERVKEMLDEKVIEHRKIKQMKTIDAQYIPAELQDLVS